MKKKQLISSGLLLTSAMLVLGAYPVHAADTVTTTEVSNNKAGGENNKVSEGSPTDGANKVAEKGEAESATGPNDLETKSTEANGTENSVPKTQTGETDKVETPAEAVSEIPKDAEPNYLVRPTIPIKDNKVYMTETQKGEFKLDHKVNSLEDVSITFGDKNIQDWKRWQRETGKFDGENVFSAELAPDKKTVIVTMKPLFNSRDRNRGYYTEIDLSQRWPNNLRRLYGDYIKDYDLAITDKEKKVLNKTTLTLRPYEHYLSYDVMVKKTDEIKDKAKKDRYVTIEEIGKSIKGRPIRMGIVAKDKQSVDDYLSKTTPEMLNHPDEMLKKLEKGQLDYKVPIFMHNTHADEEPAIDIVAGLFDKFANEDVIRFKGIDENKKKVDRKIDVKKALDKAFFLFTFVENPDGRSKNERSNANGYDVNRDHGYQMQPESRAMAKQINRFNPLTFMDFHGFQKDFLIEPCTAPHDPNFEYDLMLPSLEAHADAMGTTALANTRYRSYITPRRDWKSGWDDDFSGYTAVYSIYHNVVGHTIELPHTNEESYQAGLYVGFGGIDYALKHRDTLFANKLKAFSRGIHGIEDPKTEKEFTGPKGEIVGRPKVNGEHFFPNYYVIPMTPALQKDPNEAYEMIDYFKRNGVKVQQLKEDIKGTSLKAGDLVVDMAQAKRGVANMALWRGSNDSAWDSMYAEVVVNFPVMRGFDILTINQKSALDGKLTDVTWTKAPRNIPESAPYYFVENNSMYVVKAINKALEKGLPVYLAKNGFYFREDTLKEAIKDVALKAKPLQGTVSGAQLVAKKVYAPGSPNKHLGYESPSRSSVALLQMGFSLVDNYEAADVLVLEDDKYDPEWIGKKPVIFIGDAAIQHAIDKGKLKGVKITYTKAADGQFIYRYDDFEGLMKATANPSSLASSGYGKDTYFYSTNGAWLTNSNADFTPVLKVKEKDAFVAGWWPKHEQAYGQIVALDGRVNGQPTLIFVGSPLNKMHTHEFYRWVSNAFLVKNLLSLHMLLLKN